jgi:hypothetical protein
MDQILDTGEDLNSEDESILAYKEQLAVKGPVDYGAEAVGRLARGKMSLPESPGRESKAISMINKNI